MLRGLWLAARGGAAGPPLAAAVLLAACTMAGLAPCGRAHAQEPGPTPRPAADLERKSAYCPSRGAMTSSCRRARCRAPDFTVLLDKEVAEIPMRDGVTLHTEIYSPRSPRRLPSFTSARRTA